MLGRYSKALAGGLGAALAKVIAPVVAGFFPDMDTTAIEYIIYTLLVGGTVWAAPANAPAAPPAG